MVVRRFSLLPIAALVALPVAAGELQTVEDVMNNGCSAPYADWQAVETGMDLDAMLANKNPSVPMEDAVRVLAFSEFMSVFVQNVVVDAETREAVIRAGAEAADVEGLSASTALVECLGAEYGFEVLGQEIGNDQVRFSELVGWSRDVLDAHEAGDNG